MEEKTGWKNHTLQLESVCEKEKTVLLFFFHQEEVMDCYWSSSFCSPFWSPLPCPGAGKVPAEVGMGKGAVRGLLQNRSVAVSLGLMVAPVAKGAKREAARDYLQAFLASSGVGIMSRCWRTA